MSARGQVSVKRTTSKPVPTEPRLGQFTKAKESAQKPVGSSEAPRQTTTSASSPKSKNSTPRSKVAPSNSDTRKHLENQLGVSVKTEIHGSCSLAKTASDGSFVFRLTDEDDKKIVLAVENLQRSGKDLAARLTWASRKTAGGQWEPILLVGYGESSKLHPELLLVVLSFSDYRPRSSLREALKGSICLLPVKDSDLYVMPRVLLWDGTLSPRGQLIGQAFRGATVSGKALRPIHLDLDGHRMTGSSMVSKAMSEDPIGTVRVTKFEPNFFRQPNAGGEFG